MKRTLYKNIAVLDARNVTEETAQLIYGIKNVAVMIVSPQSQHALAGVSMKNVATTAALPEGTELMQINGEGMLGGAMINGEGAPNGEACKPIVLMVNGQLNVEPSMKPEMIAQFVRGGCVNGQIVASESQMRALYAAGLMLNGQAETYPDGYERRGGGEPITVAEVQSWPEGARKCMPRRVHVESGALEEIRARGAKITGSLIVDSKEAALLREVYEGDTSACQFVPSGMRVIVKHLKIDHRNAMILRGRIWVWGNVLIESDVTEGMLKGLEALHVHGKLTAPGELIGALMERVNEDAQWEPYEGKIIRNDEELTLDADMLEEYETATLFNKADMVIDPELSVETLRGKIAMVYNDGNITGDKKQLAVLRARLAGGEGTMNESEKEEEEEPAVPEEELSEDVIVVKNCARMVI